MPTPARLEDIMTRLPRTALAAAAFLFLLASVGCRPGIRMAAGEPAAVTESAACGEGLFAARAWECLRGGNPGVP